MHSIFTWMKKYFFKLFKTRKKNSIRIFLAFIFGFLIVGIFRLPELIIESKPLFHFEAEDSFIGIVSIIVTILSAFFIVFQLKDSEDVTCCDMLSEMNLSFIENERLMLLYQKLEECYRNSETKFEVFDDNEKDHIHTSDLVAYFTFFEVLNEYLKHKVATIDQLDDLFGYRFFILVHNKYVQERELYAVPSSYVNIFQLYDVWINYRKANATNKHGRLVIMQENQIPEYYLKKKIYLEERMYNDFVQKSVTFNKKGVENQFELRTLFPSDLKKVLAFQQEIVSDLNNKDIFQPSTENEILESMLVDCCYGLFHNDKLIALLIIVLNRKSNRNLCSDWESKIFNEPYWDYITFDTVQVHPDYRGYGIQKYFLDMADNIALKTEAKYIVATVSPDNPFSFKNFEDNDYYAHLRKNPYNKYGSKRILYRKDIS